MRIGELAAVTAPSPRALRHYESVGLVRPVRSDNGYRWYDDAAVARVRNIRMLLDAGLTLDDVRAFGPCLEGDMSSAEPSPDGLEIARRRLAVIEARIAAQTAIRDRLAAALSEADR